MPPREHRRGPSRCGRRERVIAATSARPGRSRAWPLPACGACAIPGRRRSHAVTQAIGRGEARARRIIARASSPLVANPRLVRDLRRPAAVRIRGPGLRQIQLPVHQGPALGRCVGGEDSDLAVLGAAGGAGVLPLHPGRGGALLEEAGVVHDQDPVRGAEALGNVVLEVVPDLVSVPGRTVQQVLEAGGSAVTCVLGKLPAVLPSHRCQQSTHVVPHPPPQIHP